MVLVSNLAMTAAELQLAEESLHRFHLLFETGMTRVDHVQEHVGLFELFERGLECGHELMRQLADEAHRIGQDEGGAGGARDEPGRRIKGDEEAVGGGVL